MSSSNSNSKLGRTAGLLFLAAASVYSLGVARAAEPTSASPAAQATKSDTAGVKVLEEASDPFANGNGATTQPATEGRSVTATDVNVNDQGAVEIHVNDANLVEVLRMLSLQSQRNIIASKDVKGTITANLYDVTVREALDAILHANGYAYREKGNFIYVYTAKEMAEQEKADRKASSEVFRLYYTPAANAVTMIKPVLSTDAVVSSTTPAVAGIETGVKDLGGDSHATEDTLVVTDYPENLEKVRKVLREIDRRPQQILVEATILRATLTENNALGVDFNFLGGVDFGGFDHSNGQITGGQIAPATPTPLAPADHANSIGTGNNFSSGINGFRVGVLTNSLSVFVSALEQITDTTVLANPKVLALNKQKGEVIVGRKDGYLTTTVTQTSTVQTVDFLDTGTRLIFRPFIGDDGYVRMEIHPEDSSGGLNASNLPFKVTTEVTSNIIVKDGRTIVIGGLFREDSSIGRSQIPFFGNIPLAGTLFRKQTDATTREEVIILLTPHVIKDDKIYSDASQKEREQAEKLRVGIRQGMMPTGRERLAEAEYQTAVEEMNKATPDRQKALWHLNLATNLNPKFSEAINLKQSVTGEEITTADNSTIRAFVRQQIMADPAGTGPSEPKSVPIVPSTQPAAGMPVNKASMTKAEDSATTQAVVAEAEASTTQPSVATASDATSDEEATATAPSTEVAKAATSAPSTEVAKTATSAQESTEVAKAATTQPSELQTKPTETAAAKAAPAPAIVAEEEATASEPATTAQQPVASATTKPSEFQSKGAQVQTAQAAAPSTQPVAQKTETKVAPQQTKSPAQEKSTAVTELPLDEVQGGNETGK